MVLGSDKRRLDKIARQLQEFAPSLTVTRPRFGSLEAISVELEETTSFIVASGGRGLLVGRVVMLAEGNLEASDPVPCATTIHTNDRIALMILSRVADALEVLSTSNGNTPSARRRARNALELLTTNLAARGIARAN